MNKNSNNETQQNNNDHGRLVSTVCVYCGSGHGSNQAYKEAAKILGMQLARKGISLVYGGGGLGLMGTVAQSVIAEGGHVTGIMPHFLVEREKPLSNIEDLVVVDNMHQRKMAMFERSDAFVALPGGIGTLEELVEQLTWAQLGQHKKPIVLANIENFWTPMLSLLGHMRDEMFIREGMQVNIAVVNRAEDIVPSIENWICSIKGESSPNLDFINKF